MQDFFGITLNYSNQDQKSLVSLTLSLLIKVSHILSHHKVSSVLSLNPRLTKHKHFYGNAFVDEDSEGHAGRGCKVNSAISSD